MLHQIWFPAALSLFLSLSLSHFFFLSLSFPIYLSLPCSLSLTLIHSISLSTIPLFFALDCLLLFSLSIALFLYLFILVLFCVSCFAWQRWSLISLICIKLINYFIIYCIGNIQTLLRLVDSQKNISVMSQTTSRGVCVLCMCKSVHICGLRLGFIKIFISI